jgi:quinol monooxygenase YgiN
LSPGQAARFIVFERYRDADAALEHFAKGSAQPCWGHAEHWNAI